MFPLTRRLATNMAKKSLTMALPIENDKTFSGWKWLIGTIRSTRIKYLAMPLEIFPSGSSFYLHLIVEKSGFYSSRTRWYSSYFNTPCSSNYFELGSVGQSPLLGVEIQIVFLYELGEGFLAVMEVWNIDGLSTSWLQLADKVEIADNVALRYVEEHVLIWFSNRTLLSVNSWYSGLCIFAEVM